VVIGPPLEGPRVARRPPLPFFAFFSFSFSFSFFFKKKIYLFYSDGHVSPFYWFDVALTWYLTEFDFRDQFVIIVYHKDLS
jgi:hypothetical protein